MKRIVFIDEDTGCAGATVSLLYIIKRFVRDGYTVSVYTQKSLEDLKLYHEIGASTFSYKQVWFKNLALGLYLTSKGSITSLKGLSMLLKDAGKFLFGIFYFYRQFKTDCPDFVYVNEYVIPQAIIAAHVLKIPCGVHIRSNMVRGAGGIRRRALSQLIGRMCDVIIPITDIEGQQLCLSPVLARKIHVIGEFLDERNFHVDNNVINRGNEKQVDCWERSVVMLGGISSIKGTLEFLRAARYVTSRRRDVQFVIAGKANEAEPDYCERCMKLIRSNDLYENVQMPGQIREVSTLIASADLIVSPNTLSHFSRPVIEAWALRKPVVSSNTAHAKNLIADGSDGILVDINDPAAFGDAILRILGDPVLASALAERGYEKANALFNAEHNTGKIVEYVSACIK